MTTAKNSQPKPEEFCEVCGMARMVSTIGRSMRVVAHSTIMHELLKRTALFAETDAPVVIVGESGTGKEVIARSLHAHSARRDQPFVAVNVAALPAELLESELFGHVRGAFTGAAQEKKGLMEAAHGGTLFLDEVAEMPLPLQAKLLRALQDGEIRRVGDTQAFAVDVRLVCATHRNLSEFVARGQFREDLYYRLKVLTLNVPPLRQRRDDIVPLAQTLLAAENREGVRFSDAALRLLEKYDWPGNVRELSNVVKHGVALARVGEILPEHLPEEIHHPGKNALAAKGAPPPTLKTLAEAERDHILFVLEQCGGSQVEAARALGIGRNTLWRKLRGANGIALALLMMATVATSAMAQEISQRCSPNWPWLEQHASMCRAQAVAPVADRPAKDVPIATAAITLPLTPATIVDAGDRNQRLVALTFDACATKYPAGYDEGVINVLIETGTPATLFLGGKWMESQPEMTRFLASVPLFELANHSYSHPHLTKISSETLREEIERPQAILFSLTGRHAKLFRPPFVEYNERVLRQIADQGLIPVGFDLAGGDSDPHATTKRLTEWVVSTAKNGAIVVMHFNKNGLHTAEALPDIIAGLRRRGFTLVTVGELMEAARHILPLEKIEQSVR